MRVKGPVLHPPELNQALIVHPNRDFCNHVEGEERRPDLVQPSRGVVML